MTSQLDVVGIASGNVRVSVDSITNEDRVRLFWLLARPLEQFLSRNRGGTGFHEWRKEGGDGNRTRDTLAGFTLSLDHSLEPEGKDYSIMTRMHVIAANYYRLPDYDLPHNGGWKSGEKCLVVRICVTNVGKFYLERYEAFVSRGMDDPKGLCKVVASAKYLQLTWWDFDDVALGNTLLRELFGQKPELLVSTMYGILSFFHDDTHARKLRLQDSQQTFAQLRGATSMFFSYP